MCKARELRKEYAHLYGVLGMAFHDIDVLSNRTDIPEQLRGALLKGESAIQVLSETILLYME